MDRKIAFSQLQSQQPQTLAHALADSPAGLLGWNTQLMTPDSMGDKLLDPDFVVANTALYWLTNAGGSSIRFYYEDAHTPRQTEPTTVPLGVAGFDGDFSGVRRFAERDHKNLVQWALHPGTGRPLRRAPGTGRSGRRHPQLLPPVPVASALRVGRAVPRPPSELRSTEGAEDGQVGGGDAVDAEAGQLAGALAVVDGPGQDQQVM